MENLERGELLVKLARQCMVARVKGQRFPAPVEIQEEFSDYQGCFVTLRIEEQLRGCIGYPEPIMPLYEAVASAAENVTFRDFRFPSVSEEELPFIRVEVDLLTPPRLLVGDEAEDYLEQIDVGRDGLLIRSPGNTGLLLPQVATRYGWNAEEFLRQTCCKANLPEDAWYDLDRVRVYTFQVEAFGEIKPGGEVEQII
jgi:AmmeMemoRadiSam system protein A